MYEGKPHQCPYCKEEIHPEAIKCKHCGSSVTPEKLPHKGICPYCKEEIHVEAIKCKHCKSSLINKSQQGCDCRQPADSIQTVPQIPYGQVSSGLNPQAAMARLSGGFGFDPRRPVLSNQDGGIDCFNRIKCEVGVFGLFCWLERCCFGSQGWGCIER